MALTTWAEFLRWAGYLNGVMDVVLLIQLLRFGLAGRYSWLFGYFLVDVLQAALAGNLSRTSLLYGYVYFGGQALKLLLGAALAMSLWRLGLLQYPALAQFGRKVVIYMLLGAMTVAVAGLFLEPALRGRRNPTLHLLFTVEGAVDSMILALLIAELLFLLW